MNLLERYLQAIGQHLPSATREDVLAELRANLQAQIDDRAEELNRPLTEPEVAAILKAHGRPFVVAARYLPQQYVIGPAIFPYYLMTLRKATPFVLIGLFLAHASDILFVHTMPDLIAGIARSLAQLIPDLLLFAAWLTIAFAIAEFVYTRNHAKPFDTSWDPTKLPRLVPQPKGKSRASRIADFIFHILWFAYVLEIPRHPFLILGPSDFYLRLYSVAFSPIWKTFYILLLILLAVQLVSKLLALYTRFDHWQPVLDLIISLLGVANTAFLASAKIYFVAIGSAANQTAVAAVNHSMTLAFRIVLLIVLLNFANDVWKLLRPRLSTHQLAF